MRKLEFFPLTSTGISYGGSAGFCSSTLAAGAAACGWLLVSGACAFGFGREGDLRDLEGDVTVEEDGVSSSRSSK